LVHCTYHLLSGKVIGSRNKESWLLDRNTSSPIVLISEAAGPDKIASIIGRFSSLRKPEHPLVYNMNVQEQI